MYMLKILDWIIRFEHNVFLQRFSEKLSDCTDMEKMLDLEFIMEQLLKLLATMDLTDTASR